MPPAIFTERLLAHGPWQEFERNVARLLLHAGWRNPLLVGRSGDGGADVLATDTAGRLTLFQCKFSTAAAPGVDAIHEIRNAGKAYEAEALYVVTSRDPSKPFFAEVARLAALGLDIKHIGPGKLLEYASAVPVDSPSKLKLHEFQGEALGDARAALLDSGRAQIVLATGLGKTVIASELVADLLRDALIGEGRVLVIAHTIQLVNQLLTAFWRQIPSSIETHRLAQGERPTSFSGITFASVQTLMKMPELPAFDLVIVDEAHHLGAAEYMDVIGRLSSPMIMGITATPWRSDGVNIDAVLGPPVFNMGIKEGLAKDFLSKVDYRIFVDSVDWKIVHEQSRYGYTVAQLNKKLIVPTRDEVAIQDILRIFKDENRRRGIVFSPSQVHARSFASDLRRHGASADAITSEDSHIDRHRKLARFASGKTRFLCAIDIFNEGMDVPDVDLLVFMRVTHSRRIFIQQLGRGLRTAEDKDKVVVMDFAADIRRIHGAMDLTHSDTDDAVERMLLSHVNIGFSDRSMGNFFYEWIADMGNVQDLEDDEVVRMPIIDPSKFNFPDPLA